MCPAKRSRLSDEWTKKKKKKQGKKKTSAPPHWWIGHGKTDRFCWCPLAWLEVLTSIRWMIGRRNSSRGGRRRRRRWAWKESIVSYHEECIRATDSSKVGLRIDGAFYERLSKIYTELMSSSFTSIHRVKSSEVIGHSLNMTENVSEAKSRRRNTKAKNLFFVD